MSFPTTGVLYDFHLTENPLSDGGKWTGTLQPASTTIVPLQSDGTSGFASKHTDAEDDNQGCWADTFGPDTEVFTDVTIVPGLAFILWGRVSNPNTASISGYQLNYATATHTLKVFRVNNNSFTQIGASNTAVTLQAGDTVGMSITGGATTTITVYYKRSGTWNTWATFTDSSSPITTAGKIGVELDVGSASPNGAVDNFGGGTVVVAGTRHKTPTISPSIAPSLAPSIR